MKADAFVARLEKVKRTGRDQWIACCPAHQDRSPSMTVKEIDDGRVLVHCFAGCSVESILGAVGMDFDALFPDKPLADQVKPIRRPFPAADVLECLSSETLLVAVAAGNLARGDTLTPTDHERLKLAAARIQEGRDLAIG